MYCSELLCLNCRDNGGLLIKYNEQLTNIAPLFYQVILKKILLLKANGSLFIKNSAQMLANECSRSFKTQ